MDVPQQAQVMALYRVDSAGGRRVRWPKEKKNKNKRKKKKKTFPLCIIRIKPQRTLFEKTSDVSSLLLVKKFTGNGEQTSVCN